VECIGTGDSWRRLKEWWANRRIGHRRLEQLLRTIELLRHEKHFPIEATETHAIELVRQAMMPAALIRCWTMTLFDQMKHWLNARDIGHWPRPARAMNHPSFLCARFRNESVTLLGESSAAESESRGTVLPLLKPSPLS
jgi:hypothetical protein